MIEQGILKSLKGIKPGSTQETWAKALKAVLDAGKADGFKDAPLSAASVESIQPPVTERPDRKEIKVRLQQIAAEFAKQPLTPELVTQTHQAIWQARGELIDETFDVPPCTYTQKGLEKLKKEGKRVGYLPPEVATRAGRHKLGEMYPEMGSYSVQEGNPVTNDYSPSGWFDYEVSINAPYLDTTEDQLLERTRENGRKLLSLNQYIVAFQDSKLFTDHYLDEKSTWVRVASRHDGRMVNALVNGDGYLLVLADLKPDVHFPNFGGRSSGV